MASFSFFSRDISWLSFNERILLEAAKPSVPLLERIKFLSIYSSNLDEFYGVRMPVLMALHKLSDSGNKAIQSVLNEEGEYKAARKAIENQLKLFGEILTGRIIPQLQEQGVHLLYNERLPDVIRQETCDYFFSRMAAYTEIVFIAKRPDFFPESGKLYLLVVLERTDGKEETAFVNIPSDQVPRLYSTMGAGTRYILFIDDILKACLSFIFPSFVIKGAYSIKITRDAELELEDEYVGDIAEKIEKQIAKRGFGLATRFLYQPGIPSKTLGWAGDFFSITGKSMVEGGAYHNLKDLANIPLHDPSWSYPSWPALSYPIRETSILREIQSGDILVHAPYQTYDPILRFFNEAAIDQEIEEVYATLYRVASDSRIVHALISAAKNGKKVTVFVELKARFDEANNIQWAKKMKAAGVRIIYSIPELKVHAKVALVKKKMTDGGMYAGLLATGNLNESTARFYTDHILLTAEPNLLKELEALFSFLAERKKPGEKSPLRFAHLLVAQFNLQQQFLDKIQREIGFAQKGQPALITIKLNNLEDRVLIGKLYEASRAGVEVRLIVRSICCLIPGVTGMSENITVKRIVGKYLEHGRVFIFHNGGNEEVYLGSADWMNRNIYRRIEVCFPLYNAGLKEQIKRILALQWRDNLQAVLLDSGLNNIPLEADGEPVSSQQAIYSYLGGTIIQ